jgi:hypothetical protein
MNEAFLQSFVTILFHLTIIILCYSYKNGYFKTIASGYERFMNDSSPTASVPVENHADDSKKSFSFSSEEKSSRSLCEHAFNQCEILKPVGSLRNVSSIIREYKSDRLPITFSLPEREVKWNAFHWSLWNFTQSLWPILENVLETERRFSHPSSISKEAIIGLFLISEENIDPDESELEPKKGKKTSPDSGLTFPEDFTSYSIKNEVLFWDFMYDLLPNRTVAIEENLSSLDMCRYYSTNYRTFEGMTKVPKIVFPLHLLFSLLDSKRHQLAIFTNY